MSDLSNRRNYQHPLAQEVFPGAHESEIGKAIDWIIERCYEIGVTHYPMECGNRPNKQKEHACHIWLATYSLQQCAICIAELIEWKIAALPFDIFGELDLEQSEHLIHKAVLIQNSIKAREWKGMSKKNRNQLDKLSSRLVEQAARTHAYVRLAKEARKLANCNNPPTPPLTPPPAPL